MTKKEKDFVDLCERRMLATTYEDDVELLTRASFFLQKRQTEAIEDIAKSLFLMR